jgi:hypothetical protein
MEKLDMNEIKDNWICSNCESSNELVFPVCQTCNTVDENKSYLNVEKSIWNCKKCDEEISNSFDNCWSCGSDRSGKEIPSESFKQEREKKKKKTREEKLILTKKYNILKTYQDILYLVMFVNTGFTVYSSIQILDASKALKQYGGGNVMNNTMLSIIIAYVISMFSLFCLTKIIDFLFDLDKKSNK